MIVRFSLAKACHRNNIMVEIMTSKLACHKAIDAPFSYTQDELAVQIRPTSRLKVDRLKNKIKNIYMNNPQ